MPITYRIDHEKRVILARGYGSFTDADVFEYQRAVWSRQDVAGYDELIDMTYVSDIQLPSGQRVRELASMAAHMDHPSASSRFAIVAPQDVAYGMGRMFQAYRGSENGSTKDVGVFRTLNEALAFLGITEAVCLPPLPSGSLSETG
jgi:hypothetical protein